MQLEKYQKSSSWIAYRGKLWDKRLRNLLGRKEGKWGGKISQSAHSSLSASSIGRTVTQMGGESGGKKAGAVCKAYNRNVNGEE